MTGYEEVITTGFYWSLPSSSKGYISITTQAGSGASTNMIRLDKFFTGEKYVTCKISYYGIRYFLTGGYQQSETRTTVQTFVVKCNTVGVSLYPEEMELNIGESKALQYKFSPATSQPAATVSFSSSNPKVAEVDFVGNVHAVGVGEATITAKTNFETTATCQVKVNPVLATSIALDHDEMALFVGEKASLTATVLPGNTTNKSIQWNSDNDDVVQVSQKGELTAVGTGRAQVSASTRDGSKLTAHCNIT